MERQPHGERRAAARADRSGGNGSPREARRGGRGGAIVDVHRAVGGRGVAAALDPEGAAATALETTPRLSMSRYSPGKFGGYRAGRARWLLSGARGYGGRPADRS